METPNRRNRPHSRGLMRTFFAGIKALLPKDRDNQELDEELDNYLEAASSTRCPPLASAAQRPCAPHVWRWEAGHPFNRKCASPVGSSASNPSGRIFTMASASWSVALAFPPLPSSLWPWESELTRPSSLSRTPSCGSPGHRQPRASLPVLLPVGRSSGLVGSVRLSVLRAPSRHELVVRTTLRIPSQHSILQLEACRVPGARRGCQWRIHLRQRLRDSRNSGTGRPPVDR